MKTIGVFLREWEATYRNRLLYGISRDLVEYLSQYDEISIIGIPIDFQKESKSEIKKIKHIINICDGIIFPGGEGINKIDCEIMEYVHKIDKPTLAICLGMQIMGKTFEGTLLEKELEETHNRTEKYVHNVTIKKDSKLYEIMQESKILVNSRHHDCITQTKLNCVAYSEDNIIEAIEDKNKKFFIGVQWHPESIIDDKYSKKLFDCFVESCNL